MKYILHKGALLFLISIFTMLATAQESDRSNDKYSILTEPFNLRPINMHRGQLQISTGYKLSVRTRSFDSMGEVISLQEDGSASIQHKNIFYVKYGILEFIQVGARMNYYKQGIRGETRNYLSGINYITVNELNEYKGFEDLFIHASVSLPLIVKNFDFALTGGVSLPTARHEPAEPSHEAINLGFASYIYNYQYNNRNGMGVSVWKGLADIKLTLNKFTIASTALLSKPAKEGQSFYWTEYYENSEFYYEQTDYSYLLQDNFSFYTSLHYQAVGWLDTFLAYDYTKSTGGWVEQYDYKFERPEMKLSYLQLGFEIQLSPLLRLNEIAGFAIGGKSSDASFYILTSLSINIIPF